MAYDVIYGIGSYLQADCVKLHTIVEHTAGGQNICDDVDPSPAYTYTHTSELGSGIVILKIKLSLSVRFLDY